MLAHRNKGVLRSAAHPRHHFRGVTAGVGFQQVQYTAWMAEALIASRMAVFIQLIVPALAIVLTGFRIVAAEQTVAEAEASADNQRCVGKGANILLLNLIVLQQIVDHPHQEHHVAACSQGCIEVGDRCRSVKARIDHDNLCIIMDLGFNHPFKANRMRLGGVAAHDHHHVGVFDVIPVVGHRTATKARGQRRYGRAVTQARLVFQRQNTQRAGKFLIEQAGLITGGRRA